MTKNTLGHPNEQLDREANIDTLSFKLSLHKGNWSDVSTHCYGNARLGKGKRELFYKLFFQCLLCKGGWSNLRKMLAFSENKWG